jgi:protein-tyrosine phosphatase
VQRETAPRDAALEIDRRFNLRDLGGTATTDGRSIKRGTLFRSGSLDQLSDRDQTLFTALGIRTIVDLRSPGERSDRLKPSAGCVTNDLMLMEREWPLHELDPSAPEAAVVEFVVERYCEMLTTGGAVLGRAVTIISEACNEPVLFHCFAGKDRTGILAAVLLSLLGVDEQDIALDYAQSGPAMERFTSWLATHDPRQLEVWRQLNRALWNLPPVVILTMLEKLREQFGDVEAYVRRNGVSIDDLQRLRSTLLVERD